jgi:uncharacterized protein YdaU (DUF1376 family)
VTPTPGNKPITSYFWHVDDWRNSETRMTLSLAARGLYRELLDQCHTEGSLPNDLKILSRIAGCSLKEMRRWWPQVKDAFVEVDGRLVNPKAFEVREKLVAYHNKKSSSGTAGAKARWLTKAPGVTSNTTATPSQNPSKILRGDVEDPLRGSDWKPEMDDAAQVFQTESTKADGTAIANGWHGDSSPLPIPLPSEYSGIREPLVEERSICASGDARPQPSLPSIDDPPFGTLEIPRKTIAELRAEWFEEFWSAYWLKKGKLEARKAFGKHATSEAKKNRILEAVKAQAPEMLSRPPDKRKWAQGWLNALRFGGHKPQRLSQRLGKANRCV